MAFDMTTASDGMPPEWEKWLTIQRSYESDPPPPYGLMVILIGVALYCVLSY